MKLLKTIITCITVVAAANATEKIRVRADTWMPYNGDPAGKTPGYFIEVLREIFGEKNIDYQTMPWAQALAEAKAGTIDCVIGANRTEGEGLLFPRLSFGMPDTVLFVRKTEKWTYTSIPSLKAVKLGCIDGYSYWETLDQYIKKNPSQIHTYTGETPLAEGIEALRKGEIDVFVENRPCFIWKVKETGSNISDFRAAFSYIGEEIFAAFTPKNTHSSEWATTFDTGLSNLRKTGKLNEILSKYNMSDWAD